MPSTARPICALVIDDDEFVRSVMVRQLKAAGASAVTAAVDWRAARVALDRYPECNLVVTDLDMPGAEGPAFLDELATIRPGMALIIASALQPLVLRGIERHVRALPLRLLGCLPKPTGVDTLKALLDGLQDR